MSIPLISSSFFNESETRSALADFIINTPRFSMGAECAKFEEAFAAYQGRKHAVFVTSGSMANQVLIQALLNTNKIQKNNTVGFSAVTWPTNVMPLLQLGLRTFAIDCERDTLNVSSTILKQHLQNIDALFLTNVLGFCDDIDVIEQMCNEHNVLLIEDNCESLGSVYNNKKLGNYSLASTSSFFIGHHLSTLEGGMICTDDDELHEMLVICRAHGWDRNLSSSSQARLRQEHAISDFYALYTFYDLAYNARPTEINGWLGNNQLPHLPGMVQKRNQNFTTLANVIAAHSKIQTLRTNHMDVVSNFAVPLICDYEETATKLRTALQSANIEHRPIIAGNMSQQPFYKKYSDIQVCLNAEHIHKCGLYIPNNPDLTPDDLEVMVQAITSIL